jgi:hypothetical protein
LLYKGPIPGLLEISLILTSAEGLRAGGRAKGLQAGGSTQFTGRRENWKENIGRRVGDYGLKGIYTETI